MDLKTKVEALLLELPDREGYFDEATAQVLVREGKSASKALIEALGSDDWRLRGGAAYVLGLIGDLQAAQPLLEALQTEENEWIR